MQISVELKELPEKDWVEAFAQLLVAYVESKQGAAEEDAS